MESPVNQLQSFLQDRNWDAFLVAAPEQLSSVNARYLSGFTGSSAYLLVSRAHAWLVTDFRYIEQAAAECPGWEVVQHGRIADTLADLVTKNHLWHLGFEGDQVPFTMLEQWRQAVPAVWHATSGVVEVFRIKKGPDEIRKLSEAARIAGEALMAVLPGISGRREDDVAFQLEIEMRKRGAESLGFPTIVASGPRGALPHAHPTDRRIQPGELVTIDFGAQYEGYKSDETVTVAVGEVSNELKRMYQIVADAQAAGIEAAVPGASSYAVDHAARRVIEEAGYGPYFGHGTGHGVGLEVHESPYTVKMPEAGVALEPGMTLTVEPGIYIPGLGGVRLEDTLLITETGNKRLTTVAKEFRSI